MKHLNQITRFLGQHLTSTAPPVNAINVGRIDVDSNLVVIRVHDQICHTLLGIGSLLNSKLSSVFYHRVKTECFHELVNESERIIKKKNIIASEGKKSPFDCIKLTAKSSCGDNLTRYVRCEFQKREDFDRSGIWNVTIRDISKIVRVSAKIKNNRMQAELKVNTLMSLIQFDRDLIEEFLQSTVFSIKELFGALNLGAKNIDDLQRHLEVVYGISHQLKGDAAMLNLQDISNQVHQFESRLSILNGKAGLNASDFQRLRQPLKKIVDAIKDVNLLFDKIREGGWNSSSEEGGGDSLVRQLNHLVKKVSADTDKRMIVVDDGYVDSAIPLKYRKLVGNIITQLARNAIIHGVEPVNTRLKLNKTPYGCFHVGTLQKKCSFILTVRDDGRGLDSKIIKKSALDSGVFTRHDVMNWNKTQILNALFKPGFSTAKKLTQHAGRGIGLDIIKKSVESYNGKISIKSTLGQFTEFKIILPPL